MMIKQFTVTLNQVLESSGFALEALRGNKLRTLLSTLGITIGIFCIIMVLALVNSLERNVQQSVESLGKDVVFIDKWPWTFGSDYKWWKYMNRPTPQLSELKTIDEKALLADASALVVTLGNVTIKHESNSASGISLLGVSHHFDRIRDFNLSAGRYFTEGESKNGNSVCVIGDAIAQTLFPNSSAIDQSVKIKGAKYRVVGVIEKEGESLLGNSMDNNAMVPALNLASYVRLNSDRSNIQIQVKAKPTVTIEMLEEELRGIMRAQRRLRPGEEEDFALNKTTLIAEPVKQVFGVVTFAGWIIGGFAMLVGGFGIANIMFVSVKERTNQIGIQKSLGAKNYFILIEFLVEAIVLCLFGGAIGITLVWLLTLLVSSAIDFDIYLSIQNIFTGVMVSVVIGLISGFLPAYAASRLDPVVAIRAK
jgi:putative ABC transport system permease protein